MGKMNSGQKIFGICLLFGGIVLMVTGWILYAFLPVAPKYFAYWANQFHLWLGLFLGMFMFVHIFLGVYNWGEFKAMFGDGTQPLEEARDHNPVWVQEEIELAPVRPVVKPAPVKAVASEKPAAKKDEFHFH
jgi:formate dehydrogenase subunit gamma